MGRSGKSKGGWVVSKCVATREVRMVVDMGMADILIGKSVVMGKKRHAEWIVCLSGIL